VIATGSVPRVTYTEALAHGGALLDEMRALMSVWQAGELTPDFIRRVRRDDILGSTTARTISDYVRVFARRFVASPGTPVRYMQRLLRGDVHRQVFADLAFYYTAEQDDLLRDFTVLRYWPLVREGRLTISTDDARQFIWEAEQDGRIRAPWSASVRKDMPARLLNALADFGLLGARKGGRRQVVPYRASDGSLVYLTHLLHESHVSDASLADQPPWLLFGLESRDVLNRLDQLAGDGWFVVQRAGEVVRITWKYQRLEEVVDALAG
jgi:hypothetical protein